MTSRSTRTIQLHSEDSTRIIWIRKWAYILYYLLHKLRVFYSYMSVRYDKWNPISGARREHIPYGLNESKKLTFYKRSKCVFIHIFFRFRYSFIREICLFQLVPATFYVARLVIHFVILRSFFNSSFDGWMSILFLISRERFPFIYSVYLNVSEQRFGAGRCPGECRPV